MSLVAAPCLPFLAINICVGIVIRLASYKWLGTKAKGWSNTKVNYRH